jgi:hypothetical protein
MFAVILLGIGFIMLAGMFPVAIQQTAQTQQETVGASLALAAVKQISQHATQELFPETGGDVNATYYQRPMVLPFREIFNIDAPVGSNPPNYYQRSIEVDPARAQKMDPNNPLNPLWKTVRGDVIFSEDPRYAFVPFYQRVPGHNVVKLIVIVTQSQGAGTYEFARDIITQQEYKNDLIDENAPYATLEPRRLEAILSDGGPEADIIELKTPKAPKIDGPDPIDCVDVGAFVVVGDDRVRDNPANTDPIGWNPGDDRGRANGRIYRLGARRPELDGSNLSGGRAYELAPGYDMASRLENLPICKEPTGFMTDPKWAENLRQDNDYNDHETKSGANNTAIVFVVGRQQEDPTDKKSPYVGNVQDIAAYTTYINLK